MKNIIFIILIVAIVVIVNFFLWTNYNNTVNVACPAIAKVCPDGTAVGANSEKNCEFDPCPNIQNCDAKSTCPKGMSCYKFEGAGDAYCYSGDPCLTCDSGVCVILESYPMQIRCKDSGGDENLEELLSCEKDNECKLYGVSCCGCDMPYICSSSAPPQAKDPCAQFGRPLAFSPPIGLADLVNESNPCRCIGGKCEMVINQEEICIDFCSYHESFNRTPNYWSEACKDEYPQIGGDACLSTPIYWESNCWNYNCTAFEETNLTIMKEYEALIKTCQTAGMDFESCVRSSPAYNKFKELCENQGGYFGYIGLGIAEQCNLPTSDGGKECSDSSECESMCTIELTATQNQELEDNGGVVDVTGTCEPYKKVIGCLEEVINGTVQYTMCID